MGTTPTGVAPCCADQTNREVVERRPNADGGAGQFTVERCTVCDRKHYLLIADPAQFTATLKGLQ